jgi:hypothetical protein
LRAFGEMYEATRVLVVAASSLGIDMDLFLLTPGKVWSTTWDLLATQGKQDKTRCNEIERGVSP